MVAGIGILGGCSTATTTTHAATLSNSSLIGTYTFLESGFAPQPTNLQLAYCGSGGPCTLTNPANLFPSNVAVSNPFSGFGTFVADGAGHITSGSASTDYGFYVNSGAANPTVGDYQCTYTLSGTYSVNSTGTGTIDFVGTVTSGPCPNGNSVGGGQLLLAGGGSGGVFWTHTTGAPSNFGNSIYGTFAIQ